MAVLTAKSSTIFVATDQGTSVYRSMKDIPVPLRRKLQESLQGMHSATILIADKRGREELIRALQGQPSSVQCRLAELHRNRQQSAQTPAEPPPKLRLQLRSLRNWLELLLPLAVGASLWFFIESRF
jgi:CHAD domain-containing protein